MDMIYFFSIGLITIVVLSVMAMLFLLTYEMYRTLPIAIDIMHWQYSIVRYWGFPPSKRTFVKLFFKHWYNLIGRKDGSISIINKYGKWKGYKDWYVKETNDKLYNQ